MGHNYEPVFYFLSTTRHIFTVLTTLILSLFFMRFVWVWNHAGCVHYACRERILFR